jgi:hypothetical protein
MDIYMIQLETTRRRREYQREAELGRQFGALGPLPREQAPARARRQAAGLIGVVLVTFALLVGGATVAGPDTGNGGPGEGTPAGFSVRI